MEQTVSRAAAELERAGVRQDELRIFRLAFEEILLLYAGKNGEKRGFCLKTGKVKSRFVVKLFIDGESEDPLRMDSPIMENLLEKTENIPVWEYRGGKNIITFSYILYNSLSEDLAFAWKYVGKNRWTFFFSVTIQLISVLLGVLAPVLSARIIVQFMNNDLRQTVVVAVDLLCIQLVKNFLLSLNNKGYNRVVCDTLTDLEGDLVMGTLKIKSKTLEERGSGLFIQRLTGDTVRMSGGFSRIADMTAQAVNYIGILLAMLYVNFWIFLLTLILLVFESLIEILRTRRLYSDDRVFRNANEHFSGLVGEMVRGVKDVKQLGTEDSFYNEAKKRVSNANDKRQIMQGNSWDIKLIRWEFSEIGTLIFVVLMVIFMKQGLLATATAVVLFNYYTSLDVRAVTLAGEFMEYLKDFSLSVERVCAIMNSPEFPKERFGDEVLSDPRGEIVFKDVTFAYDSKDAIRKNRPVLDHLDMKIKPGEMIAIVGKSGCGKTTILNLLSRLYDPQRGHITLDGVDTRKLTKESLRSAMTVVNQNPYIFNMSVRENLLIAKKDMTDEEMKEVCALACIDEDIEDMPEGYDTVIGEGGVNLSGGQRQRLAIARSLLKDFRVIIFDEATSALDNVTQTKIRKAIDAIKKDRTVILIAHRLSTVIHADRILYMSGGKIIDEGKHEELLKTCRPYRELYREEGTMLKDADPA